MLGGMNKHALLIKLVILAVITVLLCIVLAQIGGLVRERQDRQSEAAQSIEQSLAGPQTLLGPVLVRNCKETWVPYKDGTQTRDIQVRLPPSQLQVSGGLTPEPRYRGLFKINSYAGKLVFAAQWDDLATLTPKAENTSGRVECGDVFAVFSATDPRGLRSVELKRDGQALAVKPGAMLERFSGGLHAVLAAPAPGEALKLNLALELVGTQHLAIVPAANVTDVSLQSSWPDPSFGGRFLPAERQVGVSGFSARWRVTDLASSAAADVVNGKAPDTLSVELIDPVNPYVMADRAIKYALMFVALTFVTVGLTELLSGRRVHPVQYLLVGMAICLFFLLLLSLSEHMMFLKAYLIAASAAAVVLTQYAAAMLGGWLRGLAFGGGIALMYGALYVLLKQEQAALVIGAVLLFAVLAVVMTLTRKLDWYRLSGATE